MKPREWLISRAHRFVSPHGVYSPGCQISEVIANDSDDHWRQLTTGAVPGQPMFWSATAAGRKPLARLREVPVAC